MARGDSAALRPPPSAASGPPAPVNGDRRWRPIRDYDVDPATLASVELAALASVWREERERLADSAALSRFEEKLRREWAIETGLIERVYAFDRGITELLIERGIDAALIPHGAGPPPETIASMIGDHAAGIDFVFAAVKDERPLSPHYVRELHALLTQTQETVEAKDRFGKRLQIPLLRGEYKRQPNNPTRPSGEVHEYCPPEQVAPQMDALIAMHHEHRGVGPEVEAAWLHHRFTQIHPFQDGNGRVARALATLVLVKAERFPLVVRSAGRGEYLDALEAADAGDLQPLVALFSEMQRREFVRALGLVRDVGRLVRAEDLIRSTRQELVRRQDALVAEWNSAKDQAEALRQMAKQRLQEVEVALNAEVTPLLRQVDTFVDGAADHDARSHYFRQQIVAGAQALEYFANLDAYRAWVRLVIRTANQNHLLIAFHGIGHEFRGVLACSAVFFQRVQTDRNDRETAPARSLAQAVFQINYREDPDSIRDRFGTWLEECIVAGLSAWKTADL